jgi:hypothetical protein
MTNKELSELLDEKDVIQKALSSEMEEMHR